MSQDKHTGSPSIQLTGEMGPSYTLYGEKKHSKATGQQMPIIEFDIAWYYIPISSIYLARIIGIGTSRFAADMKVHGFSFSQESLTGALQAARWSGCATVVERDLGQRRPECDCKSSGRQNRPSDHGWHFLLENVRNFSSWNHVFMAWNPTCYR